MVKSIFSDEETVRSALGQLRPVHVERQRGVDRGHHAVQEGGQVLAGTELPIVR